MKNKTLINIHARHYIEAVFAQRLKREGFVCPDDKLLCWYRIRNGEVLDTVSFCSKWAELPLFLGIDYETVPLFIRHEYHPNVQYNPGPMERWDCTLHCGIRECGNPKGANLRPYSADVLVYAPGHGSRGLYSLTEIILPYMQQINTAYDCYLSHKANHLDTPPDQRYQFMSREFLEEAVYAGDSEVLQRGKERIETALRMCDNMIAARPKDQEAKRFLAQWQQLEICFDADGRNEYLEILHQRETENLVALMKLLGAKL